MFNFLNLFRACMDWTREDDYKRRNNSLVYMNNETTEDTEDTFSQGPSTIWFSIFVTEFIVIFIINAVTLIAFHETTTYASALRT